MFPYFVLGLALLLGFWLMGKWFVGAEPKTVVTGLRWTVAGLAVGLVLYVLVVGSYGLVIAAFGALFPVIMAIILGRRRAKATREANHHDIRCNAKRTFNCLT